MHLGGCLCGQVRYEVNNLLQATMNCHCQYCRLAHSAPYITACLMPSSDFDIKSGESLIHDFPVDETRRRCFCSNCGTRLFNITKVPGFISLMTATLDQPELAVPIGHVNLESKLPGLKIDDELLKFEVFPTKEELSAIFAQFA